jgi:hypothetical protein
MEKSLLTSLPIPFLQSPVRDLPNKSSIVTREGEYISSWFKFVVFGACKRVSTKMRSRSSNVRAKCWSVPRPWQILLRFELIDS